jgi:glycosyltransferase involved in cell wall biosynthesis
MYRETMRFLNEYRKLRPDGKVYCGLDLNSRWMWFTNWAEPDVRNFMNQCDVVATSCRPLRDALNRNPAVNTPCRWLPNGFYNPTAISAVDPRQKENILLTVGRIGAAEKNHAELLNAFANTAHLLTGWTLRMAGPVDPGFQLYIDHYFSQYPDLKERVIFTGEITNKETLFAEYARAKIFVLSSTVEGGAPNVYAEALFHGCMFITSEIDAADEMINEGELGVKYPLNDTNALSSALAETCRKADDASFKEHIPKALRYGARYFDWNRNAKKLSCMLFFKPSAVPAPPRVFR